MTLSKAQQKILSYCKGKYSLHFREKIAVFVALVWLLIWIIIFTAIFKSEFNRHKDQIDEDDPNIPEGTPIKMRRIDWITIVLTVIVFLIALVYWAIFYHGIFARWRPKFLCKSVVEYFPYLHVRTHATEAFLMYTMLYMLGIGIVMPLLKYFVFGQQDFARGMYSMYPLVFISMLFGYYIYENFKLNLPDGHIKH